MSIAFISEHTKAWLHNNFCQGLNSINMSMKSLKKNHFLFSKILVVQTSSTCPWKVWKETISWFQRFWWFSMHERISPVPPTVAPAWKMFHRKVSIFSKLPPCLGSDRPPTKVQSLYYRLQFVKPHTLQRTYLTSAENGNFRAQIWWCWNVRGKPLKMPLDLWNFQK